MSGSCQKLQESKNTPKKSTSPGNVDKKAGKSVFTDFSRKHPCNFFRDRLKLLLETYMRQAARRFQHLAALYE